MDRDRAARLAAVLEHEASQLRRVVADAEAAVALLAGREPTPLELRGAGDVVHDFYTGAEHAFVKIATETDGGVPAGAGWHRDLLASMSIEIEGRRAAVLGPASRHALDEYLRFRHVFRNVYGFELEWRLVRPLLERLPGVAASVLADLEAFTTRLREFSRGG